MLVSAAFLLLLSAANVCRSFNVDTQFPGVFTGPSDSYFGYTVALNRNSRGPVVLIGAPKSNSTTLRDKIIEPGALFGCNLSRPITEESCKELAIMKEGNTFTWNADEYSYTDKKDGMWLGVSLDVRQSNTHNDVVVCGHLWKNKRYSNNHFVNGVCYILDADLDENNVRKLLPLIQRSYQYTRITGNTEYYFAYGQAGMSATFTEDSSNMILGSPGIFSWTGSVVNYPVYRNRPTAQYYEFDTPFPPDDIEFYAYFGYSVTSGKFFKSEALQYAVGAPRDDSHHGKVYVIRGDSRQIIIQDHKRGFQLGEYFGAAVLGVDLNGDSFSELVIGAPLHSTESGGDEGKVYVYASNGRDLTKQTELGGERKIGARFGTAIANIGDINQDGFLDIAVGAPYEEEHGAVYIYHGSKHGLLPRYVQKIEPSDFKMAGVKMAGFGIHISRGLDIDDNKYPDILVGSYASSHAVLLRSRPVIYVYPRLSFNPKQIVMNVQCENSLLNLTCVQINSCIYYKGVHVPHTLDFKLSLHIKDRRQRGFFEQDNSPNVKSTMAVSINRRECFGFRMYLRSDIKDVITPIQVRFSHELKQTPRAEPTFDEKFPVYDPDSLTSVISQVPFQTGCDKTDECHSNLNVFARRSDSNKDLKFLTLGDVSSVSIEITVANSGEPAYLSEMYIYIPSGVSVINQDICENAGQQHNTSLICSLGNPLRNVSQVTINIKLDISNLPPQTDYLGIEFEVVTVSTEVDLTDNTATIPLFFRSVYDIGVTGTSSVDQVMHEGTETLSAVITHTYIVRNYGPSPLQTVYFDLDVPYEVTTSRGIENILTFTAVGTGQRTFYSVPVFCDVDSLNIQTTGTVQKQGGKGAGEGLKQDEEVQVSNSTSSTKPFGRSVDRVKRSADDGVNATQNSASSDGAGNTKKPIIRVSCDNNDFGCIKLQCSASSLYRILNYAEISVSFQVNFSVLDDFLSRWYHLHLITSSVISAEVKEVADQNAVNDAAQVKTDIRQEGPPPPEEVESWIYFVSIGFGVLLLIIILILLIKIGFFRRKEKDKMRRLVSESKRVKRPDDKVKITEEDELEVAEEVAGESTL